MFFTEEKKDKVVKEVSTIVTKAINNALGEQETDLKKVTDLLEKEKNLKEEIITLKGSLETLRLTHKKEKTEIEFLLKMKEEKQKLEEEKTRVEIEKVTTQKEMALQKEYFEKTESLLKEHQTKMKELTDTILTRLPNVNMAIKQGYGDNDGDQ